MHFQKSILLPLLALPTALSVTTIHYYKIASCNTGTDVGSYDAPITDTAVDTACHIVTSSSPAKALYINGLDTDCGVVTYTSTTCDVGTKSPKLASKGDCYYLDGGAVIGSWKAVCGSALAQAKSGSSTTAANSTTSANATASASATGSTTTARSDAQRVGVAALSAVVGFVGWMAIGL